VGTGLTTQALCEALPSGFDSSVWKAGSYSMDIEGNLRITTTVYPSLNGVGEAYTVVKYEYNFGTESAPDWQECTLITTADEFIAIGNDETKWSGNYVLGNDIDLKGMTDVTPIGKDSGNAFTGIFSGNGYSIMNAEIIKTDYSSYVGLFGYNNGIVTDLYVENARIIGNNCVGGICGANGYYGTTRGCAFSGTVQGMQYVGGICGSSDGGTIENCYSAGDIVGVKDSFMDAQYIGGICGYNSAYCEVINCYSVCRVSCSKGVGSIIGQNADDTNANVKNCYYDKNVSSLGAIGAPESSSSSDNDANNVRG